MLFSPIPLVWTGFRLISIRRAKHEFCNKKGIFSAKSDVITQVFFCCFSRVHTRQYLDFDLSL